jgi:hypothetical protein
MIDHGPIFASVASKAAWPRESSALRQTCAITTGITMYSTTEVINVSQGTVMDDRPKQQRDDGCEGEHHDGVVQRHLAEREERVAVRQPAPHEDHRRARRGGQQDQPGDVAVQPARQAGKVRTHGG